jgi:hypothetical protein
MLCGAGANERLGHTGSTDTPEPERAPGKRQDNRLPNHTYDGEHGLGFYDRWSSGGAAEE